MAGSRIYQLSLWLQPNATKLVGLCGVIEQRSGLMGGRARKGHARRLWGEVAEDVKNENGCFCQAALGWVDEGGCPHVSCGAADQERISPVGRNDM